ncbi:unnamed protein product [marine sediment metagenome]|uniref:Cation efflux protein transmembrane domain-containing protein n=1 Tax=marine sediment metagenome TaxID=412755 RepID=X1NQ14_9ZZZZ
MANHAHHRALPVASKLKFGIMLSSLILAAELAGGLLANSLALLADAGHVFADVIALSLSWYGVKQAERPASHSMTFGYHRVGVLIAIVNALSILSLLGEQRGDVETYYPATSYDNIHYLILSLS